MGNITPNVGSFGSKPCNAMSGLYAKSAKPQYFA